MLKMSIKACAVGIVMSPYVTPKEAVCELFNGIRAELP